MEHTILDSNPFTAPAPSVVLAMPLLGWKAQTATRRALGRRCDR
jgi:hypothetical protein